MKKKTEQHSILHAAKKNLFFYCFVLVIAIHLPIMFYKHTEALVSFTYDEINSNISRIKLIVKSIQAPSKNQKIVKKVIKKKKGNELEKVKKSKKTITEQQPIEEDTSKVVQESKGINDIEALYKKQLRSLLNASREYPKVSRRLGHQGRVVLSFVIEKSGLIQDIKLITGSKYKNLNKAGLKAVQSIYKFKPFPPQIKKSHIQMTLPFNFTLN